MNFVCERQGALPLLCMFITVFAGLGVLLGSASAAAQPPLLWQAGETGEAAGQTKIPRGVAAEPERGNVYVVDQENLRVDVFSALGEFVRAWGWGVVDGSPELQVCTDESGCQKGITGSGTGQFGFAPQGVAVDSAGDVYVTDRGNRRVQKFDSQGNFLLMFGGEVNKTKVEAGGASEAEENLCPFDPGDVCKGGVAGAGAGQFEVWPVSSNIAVGPGDAVWVGDSERIQRFDIGGAYQGEIALPGKGHVATLAADPDTGDLYTGFAIGAIGFTPKANLLKLSAAGGELCTVTIAAPYAIATDASRNLYAVDGNSPPTIRKFSPSCVEVDDEEFPFTDGFNLSTGLATNLCEGSDPPGNLYVANSNEANSFLRAYGTFPVGCLRARTLPADPVGETSATLNGTVNPKGEAVSECFFEWGTSTAYDQIAPCEDPSAGEIGSGSVPVAVQADISGLVKGTVYHFRLRAEIGGELESGLDEQFKTLGAPVISEEHVVVATHDEARLRALVNPEGFATECQIQYGLTDTYGQSTSQAPVGSDRSEHQVTRLLEGLEPGTTYHWRFACANSSGPVFGADRILVTYRLQAPPDPCPNDAFRGGASATLPDCRAYEMVSPVDKNGADIALGRNDAESAGLAQANLDGEKITYTTKGSPAFGEDPPVSVNLNQYIATRQESDPRQSGDGWSNEAIHQPYVGDRIGGSVPGAFREFMAFTPDLCSAWVVDRQTPPLNPDGQEGFANLLRRDNCEPEAGSFETLTTAPVPESTESNYVDQNSVQGHSEDGSHAVFAAKAALEGTDAAAGTHSQLYDRFEGELALVSVLPTGLAATAPSAVGSGWNGNLENAVSADGSVVYWTSGGSEGQIYARLHPEQGIVAGECVEPSAACTVPVNAGGSAFFWGASPDGSRALYSQGNLEAGTADLYRFDLASEASQPLAEDVRGVAGASDDLSRVYFVSETALPGSGPNGEEEEAVEGEPNLYLAQGGAFEFIGTLSDGDMGELGPDAPSVSRSYNLAARDTFTRATRVTPDGSHLAFQAQAPLTGYDNTDPETGKAAVEVFSYEAGSGELLCVSCNPSRARPQAREWAEPYEEAYDPGRRITKVQAAAWIPTWQQPTHASNVLSADGKRLFFNSNDALLPGDANGVQDVYEWEAPGSGSCDLADANYFAENGGCIYLISDGESSFEAEFWEASLDGEDVFFTTESQLLPQDPGSIDLYDARVGGGFPQPVQASECEGEACQSPPPPPEFGAPASRSYNGPGNAPAPRSCAGPAKRAAKLSRQAKQARRAAKRADNSAAAKRLNRKAQRLGKSARKLNRKAKRCRRANRRAQK